MNEYERLACNQVFLSYPTDKSFAFIIMLCKTDLARKTFNDTLSCHLNGCHQLILSGLYSHEPWQNIPGILSTLIKDAQHKHPGFEHEARTQPASYGHPLGQNT